MKRIIFILIVSIASCSKNESKKETLLSVYFLQTVPVTLSGALLDKDNKPLSYIVMEIFDKEPTPSLEWTRAVANHFPERLSKADEAGKFSMYLDKNKFLIKVKDNSKSLGTFEVDLSGSDSELKPILSIGSEFTFNGKLEVK